MSREIKFRFRLKSKEDGEVITQTVELYNEMNGLMQFPIELDKWEVLSTDEYTGLTDENGKGIHESDILRVAHEDGDSEVYQVRYMVDNDYPAFDLVPHLDCDSNGLSHAMAVCKIEVIGNIYEHPHLLTKED